MDLLTIDGGTRLEGTIRISGSKNAALPILVATLLTDETCILTNVPNLVDIETMIALLVFLGKEVIRQDDTITVSAGPTLYAEAPYELVRRMRASIVVMGPLLARLKKMKASLPGGCAIGGRPINIHLDGFRAMGADINLQEGYIEVECQRLKGCTFHLDFASVGATQNLMMAATLAEGRTTLINAAMEPEITDLANFLMAMGAQISGAGTETIVIDGVPSLHGSTHEVIADRIEAGTFMAAAAITQGELTLTNLIPNHLAALIAKMRQSGIKIVVNAESLTVSAKGKLQPVSVETAVHPGFPTDLQAQWMALMTLANGTSYITERVFENRFMHVPELQRMGADITIRGNTAGVKGVDRLSGAHVMVSDLRAGAALVLAALAANSHSVIHRIYHLDRGYENLEQKLTGVGAHIIRGKE